MTARNSLHIVGVIVLLISFWYLGSLLSEYWRALTDWELTGARLAILTLVMVGYVIALFALSEAWHLILYVTSGSPGSRGDSYSSFLSSQIIKYFPVWGVHLAGRHIWLKRLGYQNKDLTKAAVLEAGLTVSTALILGAICGLVFLSDLPQQLVLFNVSLPMLLLMGLGCLAGIVFSVALPFAMIKEVSGRDLRELYLAQFWIAIFFLLQSSLFVVCCIAIGVTEVSFVLTSVFLLSWLAGYLVIGAPGGLGVRETVFLLLGGTLLPVEGALLAILIFRIVTILGEAVVFFLGGSLKFRKPLK